MKIELRETEVTEVECTRIVEFVNRNYASELPLQKEAIMSGKVVFYWALDAASGEVVGVTGYMPKTKFLAETVKTVVDPKFRGKGAGAAISLAMENQLRRLGFKKVMSTILIDNLPMIIIKLKQGYVIEGTHFDHEKPGLHEYSLGKIL